VYVVLYQPESAEPEVFGPYGTPNAAASALRRIAASAGAQLDVSYSSLLATLDLKIDGERHRYQLLKVASSAQLDVHSEVIEELAAEGAIGIDFRHSEPAPSPLSGY
jgi:hypothetical protein